MEMQVAPHDPESAQPAVLPRVTSKRHCSSCACLAWRELKVVTQGGKVILDSVSGLVEPGHLLAIMGPSGSGKSTLLDTLAGRSPKSVTVTGDITLNGHVSNLSYGVSSYVTQDDLLIGVLTVRETLRYSALLRLPRTMSRADKEARVDTVLADLGLVDCQDVMLGNWFLKGCSGGQRRRVSIGCELVMEPTLMFLDEPTSGLDAAAAFYVMEVIAALAAQNRTILSVIHQPSSEVFELFDKLALLTGGEMVFFGDAAAAEAMFVAAGLPCPSHRSATDHFLHCINTDFTSVPGHAENVHGNIQALTTHFNTTMRPDVIKAVEQQMASQGTVYERQDHGPGALYQTAVLTHRNLLSNVRDIGVFWLRLGMFVVLCICIGTIFFDMGTTWKDTNLRAAMLFFVCAFLTFMSIAACPAFTEELKVYIRERLNGYYTAMTYVVANTLSAAPFVFLIAVSASLVVYWLAGLNDNGDRVIYFIVDLFAALMVVESMMLAICGIMPHYLMSIAAGAGILGMFMLVNGFFVQVDSIPAPVWRYPMHYISFQAYSFAGFMRNEFDGTTGWGCPCQEQPGGCAALGDPNCTVSGQTVLEYWLAGTTINLNKWVDVGIQFGMMIGYRVIFWAVLMFKEMMSK